MKYITLKITPAFERKAKKLMTKAALELLYDYVLDNPEKGQVIRGTSGIRKLRWRTGKNDKGKSGGVRVLYHYSKDVLLLLIAIYSKTDKVNVNQQERNELKRLLPELVAKYRGELLNE